MTLETSIKDADPFLKKYASRLATLNIFTFADFLYHIPFRYEDYSLISPISKLQPGETVTVMGKVLEIKSNYTKQRFKTMQKATIADETGEVEVLWFNQPYLAKMIHNGDTIAIAGKVEKNFTKQQFTSPEYELLTTSETLHTGRLVPVYHETKGVSSKFIRRQIHKIIRENKATFAEHIPSAIINKFGFMDFAHTMNKSIFLILYKTHYWQNND